MASFSMTALSSNLRFTEGIASTSQSPPFALSPPRHTRYQSAKGEAIHAEWYLYPAQGTRKRVASQDDYQEGFASKQMRLDYHTVSGVRTFSVPRNTYGGRLVSKNRTGPWRKFGTRDRPISPFTAADDHDLDKYEFPDLFVEARQLLHLRKVFEKWQGSCEEDYLHLLSCYHAAITAELKNFDQFIAAINTLLAPVPGLLEGLTTHPEFNAELVSKIAKDADHLYSSCQAPHGQVQPSSSDYPGRTPNVPSGAVDRYAMDVDPPTAMHSASVQSFSNSSAKSVQLIPSTVSTGDSSIINQACIAPLNETSNQSILFPEKSRNGYLTDHTQPSSHGAMAASSLTIKNYATQQRAASSGSHTASSEKDVEMTAPIVRPSFPKSSQQPSLFKQALTKSALTASAGCVGGMSLHAKVGEGQRERKGR